MIKNENKMRQPTMRNMNESRKKSYRETQKQKREKLNDKFMRVQSKQMRYMEISS